MKIKFNINYNTQWGESIHVLIVYRSRDGVEKKYDLPMNTDDGSFWTLETSAVDSRQHPVKTFVYKYVVEDQDGKILRREWNGIPREYFFDQSHDYIFIDQWKDLPLQYHLFSDAYSTVTGIARQKELKPVRIPIYRKTVVLRAVAPQLQKGQALAVIGNHPAIGNWSTARYLKMQYQGCFDWIISINVDGITLPMEYKFVVVDDKTHEFVAWEEGENRSTVVDNVNDGQVVVVNGEQLRIKEHTFRAAGVVIPVFSLRSEHSYGVGDFGDLRRMVDWVSKTGMKMIQILPVNDTSTTGGWTDSYPYNAISVFALHPHYLDLEQLGDLHDKAVMNDFHRQRQELNALNYSDYLAVDRVKKRYIHQAFLENGETVLASDKFKAFFDRNKDWLRPYAAFSVLRDKYATARYSDWGESAVYSDSIVDGICAEDSPYINKVYEIYYVQYNLHQQLKSAADYARQKHVAIKGDLQIGVNRDSVETWQNPQYFNLDMQTGAPPDAFSQNGQNWAFPTYNWKEMEKDGFAWFKRRFQVMEQYFDSFRIDHVLGFFRIWEIPEDAISGVLGHFSPALPMTEEEISYFGLQFRRDLLTHPFINDRILEKIFGVHRQYVCDNFLTKKAYGLYDLKPEYNTQKKVRKFFEGCNDENSIWIRDGLYRLVANVLFLEDPRQKGMYHPRIGGWQTMAFDVLNEDEKDAYMRLYNNYFYRRHDDFWRWTAMNRLPNILSDTRMLVCAEDLGMLPSCVGGVLDYLRILSLQIQTMPKENGTEFSHLGGYPYRSVATITTHDMAPLRLSWEESPERTQRYFTSMLQKEGKAPRHITPQLAEEIIARHMYCPSMLCMISFQDLTAMDSELRNKDIHSERINVPSDSYNRWQYRMHITIEKMIDADLFNRKLRTMVERSRR